MISIGALPVACRSRRQAMYRPSGETRGFSKSYPGTDSSTPSKIRIPVPDSRSSGSEYPNSPSVKASVYITIPISQLTSRGLR